MSEDYPPTKPPIENDRENLIGCIASKINEYGIGSLEFSIAIGRTVYEYLNRNGRLRPLAEAYQGPIRPDGTSDYGRLGMMGAEQRAAVVGSPEHEESPASLHNRITQLERRCTSLEDDFGNHLRLAYAQAHGQGTKTGTRRVQHEAEIQCSVWRINHGLEPYPVCDLCGLGRCGLGLVPDIRPDEV